MTPAAQFILDHLATVEEQRALREQDPTLTSRVRSLKSYQQARFAKTYADLLQNKRYAAPAQFFLDELYGPHDFTQRDRQFARVVPTLTRLFPHEIVDTVASLAALHALTETLDTEMAKALNGAPVSAAAYTKAWQLTGRARDRERQIQLTMDVGHALERYTHRPLLRHTLRMMRGPARASGLEALQSFVERGFDRFGAMRGATEFLATIATRERALAQDLFQANLTGPKANLALQYLP